MHWSVHLLHLQLSAQSAGVFLNSCTRNVVGVVVWSDEEHACNSFNHHSHLIHNNILNNNDLELFCDVIGTPQPSVTWLHNSLPLQNSHKYQMSSMTSLLSSSSSQFLPHATSLKSQKKAYSHRLIIRQFVRSLDEGLYTCAFKNSAGSVDRNFKIVVPAYQQLTETSQQRLNRITEHETSLCDNGIERSSFAHQYLTLTYEYLIFHTGKPFLFEPEFFRVLAYNNETITLLLDTSNHRRRSDQ
ncbi:hypothetical protein HELRODRAFT_164293 [Helobdella robusta]|uniref:Ig-like domain-containing protein n=1 Tax=Helobdella robusta TaxID=6412 RepID=T1EV81_HELRO|nr:hypothetical protein HELRODRAFT_164293 [Helobdella robusta]ESN94448.1 hypothetical protein HELRODRAFT_164293 [Helobdella robusta]